MLTVTWRNLVARKVRLLLSGFAIVLGVAFVAGSLIFTGAIGGAFDDIIEGSTADVEVAFEGAGDFDSASDSRTIPASVLADLEGLPEADGVYGTVGLQTVFVIGTDGKVVGGNGPPGLAFNPTETRSITGKPIIQLVEGRLPDAAGEVALDSDTAEKGGYSIGDTVTLVTPGDPPTIEAEMVGRIEFGAGGLNGATLSMFDLGFLQEQFLGGQDAYTAISLNVAEGVTQQELADAANAVLPDGIEARTGDDVVEQNQAGIDRILGFINTFLLVFAGISLVVGTFIIINTFSILVAQRSRELALLRALGASRRQVTGSVLLEALGVGLVGSTLGLAVGYLLAIGLKYLFALFGLDLGDADFPVAPTTVAASYVVGIVVTVVAAYLPARRASRIAPIQALRDDVAMPESSLRTRLILGVGLVVLGAVAMAVGLLDLVGNNLILIGGGMLAVLIGVSQLAPFVGRPVIQLFGLAYRGFGTVGRLATENSLRNPRRTAATASALMVGLALMSTMAILGSSASASTDAAVEESLTSEFIVSNVIGQPFSPALADQIRDVDGVAAVASLRQAFPEIEGGGRAFLAAVNPTDLAEVLRIPMAAGSLSDLTRDTVAVASNVAESRGLSVGDTVTLEFQAGDRELRVASIFTSSAALPAEWLVTQQTLIEAGLAPLDSLLFISKTPDADVDALRADIEEITEPLPTVTLKDPAGFAEEQKEQIDTLLNLINALLGLSVLIAVLGVVNTLALSVIERTREVGLLRAIGVSRRQLRTMIRLESIVIAVLGTVLGVAMGTVFGITLIRALADEGLEVLSIPWVTLGAFVLAAASLGVLAAVFPARRAARLDVLRAITQE